MMTRSECRPNRGKSPSKEDLMLTRLRDWLIHLAFKLAFSGRGKQE